MHRYQDALDQRRQEDLLRTLPLPPDGADFYSNDYLGLANSKELKSQIEKEKQSRAHQNGASGSRLLSGNSAYFEGVEEQVAQFHESEAALIYSSGYTANLGLISCLATRETTLIMDELVHASLIDGARLGVSKKVRFKHNDLEDLQEKLGGNTGKKIVIVESIYSMDGDTCPLEGVLATCEKFGAELIVDEAHAFGVVGEKGEGICQKLRLENKVLARIVTYGKGAGIHGAAVVSPKWLRDYQVNFSRPFIFSTAPSPHQFASISAVYSIIENSKKQRDQLEEIIDYFIEKRGMKSSGWLPSSTQIQSLIIPGNTEVIAASKRLQENGIIALPIRKPSVPESQERIRFCLHAFNTKSEIDQLFELL